MVVTTTQVPTSLLKQMEQRPSRPLQGEECQGLHRLPQWLINLCMESKSHSLEKVNDAYVG